MLVSVIITTYNRFELLHEAITSVLNQTHKDLEVIVVDDCSTDSRYLLLKDFGNVRFIRLQKNMRHVHNARAAQGATRNEGLKECRGDYICFLDDDDVFLPTKVEEQVRLLEQYKDHDVCGTNMIKFARNPTRQFGLFTESIELDVIEPEKVFKITHKDILRCNWVSLSSSMIRRRILQKVPEFRVCDCEDWEFWKSCLTWSDGLFLNVPLVRYDVSSAKSYRYRRK
jgi:glycosyltransferase involved in cell wall biosynthesis